jgi:exo-1,4-beta-D-glucosaminidase
MELENSSDESVHGTLQCSIDTMTIQKKITIPGHTTLPYTLLPREFGELLLKKPRIWWPYQLGTPELYTAHLSFLTEGIVSDHQEIRFGIRDIQSHITGQEVRMFTINGKDLLVRGAAWAPDLMFRQSGQRDEADIAFVKNCNLNAIRFEGNLGSDYFWDLCDREGILVLAGWPCCNHWEDWKHWNPSHHNWFGCAITRRLSPGSMEAIFRLRSLLNACTWIFWANYALTYRLCPTRRQSLPNCGGQPG